MRLFCPPPRRSTQNTNRGNRDRASHRVQGDDHAVPAELARAARAHTKRQLHVRAARTDFLVPRRRARILKENYAVRGVKFSGFDMLVRTPVARCGLCVQIYENDWTVKGSRVDYSTVSLSLPQCASPRVTPIYPLEVLAVRAPGSRSTTQAPGGCRCGYRAGG